MSGSCRLLSRVMICGLRRRGVGWGAGRSRSCVSLGGHFTSLSLRSPPENWDTSTCCFGGLMT